MKPQLPLIADTPEAKRTREFWRIQIELLRTYRALMEAKREK